MPVTVDSFLWEATGFFSSASSQTVTATHPDAGGTTAGGTVLVALCMSTGASVTVPAGFAALPTVLGTGVYVKSDVAAGETSWAFTVGAATGTWYMVEFDAAVAIEDPYDGGSSATGSVGNGGTLSTGSASNSSSSGVALAFFHSAKPVSTDVMSWSSYTNSFVERVDVSPASGSTAGRTLAVAWSTYEGWSTWSSTATLATTGGSATSGARIVLLRGAEATINAPLSYLTTFGFGTHAGFTANVTGSPVTPLSSSVTNSAVGTWGTHYSVGAYGRDGRTGLEIAVSAATANVTIPATGYAVGLNVKAVSGSGTPEALWINTSTNDLSLLYDVTNEKFGVKWTGGSTVWQTGTTPVGTWAWVDLRIKAQTSIWHADWSIETGTGDGSQSSPTDLTGQTPTTGAALVLGGQASQTGTFRYSDVVCTSFPAAYPLGPHIVRVLAPETTGATVSGTSGNFQRFTANGTLANVSGSEGGLLDDIPPTVSASSDGVVQVTAAASDYINLPMTTYTLEPDEVIAGVRAFASLWGGTGSGTGTLGFRGYDGTTETTFVAASTSFDPDSLTTASATYPMWYAAMWGVGSRWNQTLLDAAALRVGFSTDATPDMGVSCVGLEVATRYVQLFVRHRLVDGEDPDSDPDATVEEGLHPYTSGERFFRVTNNHPTSSVTFRFYDSGGEHSLSPVVLAPSDPPEDVTIGADLHGDTVINTEFGWS